MKKLFLTFVIIISICLTMSSSVNFATSINNMTEEEIIRQYEEIKKERAKIQASRDAKIEMISHNNQVIRDLKIDVLDAVQSASARVDVLLYKVQNNQVAISEELIAELTDLLEFVKDANQTIKDESKKLEAIVKDEKIRGYDSSVLVVLDSVIEKQNSIIVSYKRIIQEVNGL